MANIRQMLNLIDGLKNDKDFLLLTSEEQKVDWIYQHYYCTGSCTKSKPNKSKFSTNPNWMKELGLLQKPLESFVYTKLSEESLEYKHGYMTAYFSPTDLAKYSENSYINKQKMPNPSNQKSFQFLFGNPSSNISLSLQARLYIHINGVEAIESIKNSVNKLNDYQIPFHWKFLTDPVWFGYRSDCTVLYFLERHKEIILKILDSFFNEKHLHHEIPLFTEKINKGISWCQSPENGSSFGMERCKLVINWFAEEPKLEISDFLTKKGFDQNNLHLEPKPYRSTYTRE